MAGIAGVVAGAELLVNSAVSIMHAFGVSEKFIGLTVVAFGTSLPELATSLVAAIKKEMDISETFEKCSILFKFKEDENFKRRNTLSISRLKI